MGGVKLKVKSKSVCIVIELKFVDRIFRIAGMFVFVPRRSTVA